MRILLDTHAFLWFLEGSASLSAHARSTIEEPENIVFVSVASLWEIAIKYSLGRLDLEQPFGEFIPSQIETNGFALLSLDVPHMSRVAELPFHHRDPFDRMIIAQSLVEDLPIIGRDEAFDHYGVARHW